MSVVMWFCTDAAGRWEEAMMRTMREARTESAVERAIDYVTCCSSTSTVLSRPILDILDNSLTIPDHSRELRGSIGFGRPECSGRLTIKVVCMPQKVSQAIHGFNDRPLASKAMCTEAMEVFSRTRCISPRFRKRVQAKAPISNPLVLYKKSIRKITSRYPYDADLKANNT